MKVLELFAGTRSISKAFEARGHETFSIEWSEDFENISLRADVSTVTADMILERFGRPDVIWASPDCTTFSIAAISHHRRKNPETGNLDPVSDYAKFCDEVDQHVLDLIRALKPRFLFIENPRDAKNGMDEGHPPIYRHLLPIWRQADEADRYLDESSSPTIQAAMQEWRILPRKSAEGQPDRHPRAERQQRKKCHSCGVM